MLNVLTSYFIYLISLTYLILVISIVGMIFHGWKLVSSSLVIHVPFSAEILD